MAAPAKAPRKTDPSASADRQVAEGILYVLKRYKGDLNAFFLEVAAAERTMKPPQTAGRSHGPLVAAKRKADL